MEDEDVKDENLGEEEADADLEEDGVTKKKKGLLDGEVESSDEIEEEEDGEEEPFDDVNLI